MCYRCTYSDNEATQSQTEYSLKEFADLRVSEGYETKLNLSIIVVIGGVYDYGVDIRTCTFVRYG